MSRIVRFAKTQTDIPDLVQLQIALSKFADSIAGLELLNGTRLQNVSLLAAGPNVIAHKLGRRLTGWLISRKRGAADIYDSQDGNLSPHLTLVLNTTADVVVDLEVY